MSVDVRPEIVVRKPRSEVAAFMFDPANDLTVPARTNPTGSSRCGSRSRSR